MIRTASFPDRSHVPVLGQGTWKMAEDPRLREDEIETLRQGIEFGLTLIDTAEMYGDGKSETLIAEATSGLRDQVFLVSKAYPQNASRERLPRACEASLKRLGTDRLDLYLLHWRGTVPLTESVEAMERLVSQGKIRRWGVSNFDTEDMKDLMAAGGKECTTNQILYNLSRRGPELELLPWLAERSIPVMAYSPVEQGRLLTQPKLRDMAEEKGCTPAQIALAWLLARDGVIAIPKAGTVAHVKENRGAADLSLDDTDLARLDRLFSRPSRPTPLEML